ncbi:MAG: hypothetical protein F9K37_13680 [Bacteroidales bacterium]|nr:MAG: hypothetical protein F9K37_13680 [Bacteroidales bacterium]
MKKYILTSLLAAIAGLAANMAVGFLFIFILPTLEIEYSNTSLFRPWEDPLMSLYFFHPFYIAFILAWVWNKTKSLIRGNIWRQAFVFTGFYILLATFPGLILSISSFKISFAMTFSWAVGAFVQTYIMSLLFARFLK